MENGYIKKCESCYYYGQAPGSPETAPEECMWLPSEEDGFEPPCANSSE